MVHRLAGATMHLENFVNYNCHPIYDVNETEDTASNSVTQ